MSDARNSTIVWAIEAFPNPQAYDFELKMASALRWYFPRSKIIPVYVLSDQIFAARGFGRFLRPALKPAALKAMRRIFAELSKTHDLQITRPRVLREISSSREDCARKLVRFAEKAHADFIALRSRGLPFLAHLMGYSFSEAVLRYSRVPLFIIGPKSEICAGPPKSVIFAGDFTSTPSGTIDEILKIVANFGAELHLFHKSDSITFNPLQCIGISLFAEAFWPAQHSFHSDRFNELNLLRRFREWVHRADTKGIKTRLANENFRETNSKAIVHYLRRLGDASALVALTARTRRGPLIGNIAREVIRMSPYPVFMTPAFEQAIGT